MSGGNVLGCSVLGAGDVVKGRLCADLVGCGFGLASEASLDLYIGHLTYLPSSCDSFNVEYDDIPGFRKNGEVGVNGFNGDFIKLDRGLGEDDPRVSPKNWFKVPSEGNVDLLDGKKRYVLTQQRFKHSGFEVILKPMDIGEMFNMLDAPRNKGKREKPDLTNDLEIAAYKEAQEKSIRRAKKNIRHKAKSLGVDRLLTLTRREGDDESSWWDEKDWAKAWDKFRRACADNGDNLVYICVLERHKKGNLHLHAAIVGSLDVKVYRDVWNKICGGEEGASGAGLAGNIDISYKSNMKNEERVCKLSGYLSKYISKQIGDSDFNKKRYWGSKHVMEKAVRIVLNSLDFTEAIREASELMMLRAGSVYEDAFIFPSKNALWFAYNSEMDLPVPF